jgi:phasin family protein
LLRRTIFAEFCITPLTYFQENLMFSTLSSAANSAMEAQMADFNALAGKVVAGSEKAMALNIAAVKAYADEANVSAKDMFALKDPQAFFAIAAKQAQSAADNATANARQLTDIVTSLKADFTKTTEAQLADSKSKVTALVNEAIKNAPAGSEQAVAILKSAIDNANAGYEQLSSAVKQAAETVEAQVTKTSEQMSQAVNKGV